MQPNGSVTYTPHSDATRKAELDALAAIYSLAIRRYENNAAGTTSSGGDDTKGKSVDDFRAEISLPR
jgi:hypothetical protein